MEIVGALYRYLMPSMKIAAVIFVVWKGIWYFVKREKKIVPAQWFWQYVMLVYLQGVLFLTDGYGVFLGGLPQYLMEPNLVPFIHTLEDIVTNPTVAVEQVTYNLIFFIPFGFILPLAFSNCNWRFWKILLVSAVVIVIVETLEFLSGRYMDIDDLVINSIGSFVGYVLCIGCKYILGRRKLN